MRTKLICLLLVLAVSLLAAAPAAAQDNTGNPFVICGDLSAVDCALLTDAYAKTQELSAYAFDWNFELNVRDLPDMEINPIDMTFGMKGSWSAHGPALDAIAKLRSLYSAQMSADALQTLSQDMPNLMLDLYRGVNFDAELVLQMPQAVADSISQGSDVAFPTEFRMPVRMLDGMVYMDLGQVRELAGTEYPFTSDWIGFDLAGLMEIAMHENQKGAGQDAFGAGIGTGVATAEVIKALQAFVTVERLDNAALDGQEGAVFRSSYDVVKFLASDVFKEMATQMAKAIETQDPAAAQEIENNLNMVGFVAPMVFRDLDMTNTTTVGLDDQYIHAIDMAFNWDLAGLMQLAAMSDPQMRASLPDNAQPRVDLTLNSTYSQFGEDQTLEAPADVQIIPLDTLAPPDTSTIL